MMQFESVKNGSKIGVCTIDMAGQSQQYVIALGTFDGVHRGHRALLAKTVELAEKYRACPCVMTFANHPMEVLAPDRELKLLSSLSEKAICFADCGIHQMILLPFDLDMAQLTPEQFVEDILLQLPIKAVVCGYNYTFGCNGSGTVDYLTETLRSKRIEVIVIDEQKVHDLTVSSTQIRQLIEEDALEMADDLLGAYYIVGGQVVHGKERGRKMGFPTANVAAAEHKLLPPPGVYVGRAFVEGKAYKAVINVGNNPTFGSRETTVEAHLLDFDENLYGKYILLEFVKKLRPDIKFQSMEALSQQIHQDTLQARNTNI